MKLFSRFIVPCLFLALALSGCQDRVSTPLESGTDQQAVLASAGAVGLERAIAAQEQHNPRLLALPDVVGTAAGLAPDGTPAVLVLTKAPGVAGIPGSLDGVPVVVKVTGEIRALQGNRPDKPVKPDKPGGGGKDKVKIDPTSRFDRPVPTGGSTGSEVGVCAAGTIGCRLTDGTNVYALSNNHVYADENNAPIGSRVLQPGPLDADPQCAINLQDGIGTLADFEPLDFSGGVNTIDAAIAVSSTDDLGNATPSNGYGTPSSAIVPAALGQKVKKYGRTTGQTKGLVTGINFSGNVGYGEPGNERSAYFENQILVQARRPFIGPGDSGSLLVTDNRSCNPVGLLFAGDETGTLAVANPIDAVLARFGVTVDGK
jgi:hypothetical protein